MIAIPILLWLCSFFLPAITFPPDTASRWSVADGMQRGYEAALLSFVAFIVKTIALGDALTLMRGQVSFALLFFTLMASLWLANFWMIAAPFRLKSLLSGGGRFFLITNWLWVVSPLPLAWNNFKPMPQSSREYTLQIGFFLWWFSLLLLASICTAFRFRSSTYFEVASLTQLRKSE
jgi:hypothetical protein